MDLEIKDILVKLLEGQTRLETDVSNLKTEVNKNSIKLESIEKKLDIIAEVQTSHKEQNERAFKGLDSKLEEKTCLTFK